MLIEKITGHPYAEAIRNGIVRPLHLTNTFLPGASIWIPGPVSRGYEAMDIGGHTVYIDVTEANPTLQWSASEMISNAPDLDRTRFTWRPTSPRSPSASSPPRPASAQASRATGITARPVVPQTAEPLRTVRTGKTPGPTGSAEPIREAAAPFAIDPQRAVPWPHHG